VHVQLLSEILVNYEIRIRLSRSWNKIVITCTCCNTVFYNWFSADGVCCVHLVNILTCSRRFSASVNPCSWTVMHSKRCSTNLKYELQHNTTLCEVLASCTDIKTFSRATKFHRINHQLHDGVNATNDMCSCSIARILWTLHIKIKSSSFLKERPGGQKHHQLLFQKF